jgi:peptidoglycan/LPS O-acetylase OafA/YrhL
VWISSRRALIALAVSALLFGLWTFALYYGKITGPPFPKLVEISHKSQFLEIFLVGSIGAVVARAEFVRNLPAAAIKWIEIITAVTVVGLLLYTCAITCQAFLWFERTNYTFRFQSLIFSIVFCFLLFVIQANENSATSRFFNIRWLRMMGVWGFSWYLLHFPIFQGLNLLRESVGKSSAFEQFAAFVVSWLLCALFSYLGFTLIEKPGMQLGRRLAARSI